MTKEKPVGSAARRSSSPTSMTWPAREARKVPGQAPMLPSLVRVAVPPAEPRMTPAENARPAKLCLGYELAIISSMIRLMM